MFCLWSLAVCLAEVAQDVSCALELRHAAYPHGTRRLARRFFLPPLIKRLPHSKPRHVFTQIEPPKVAGKPCLAWTTYDIEEEKKFMPFRNIDKLRMMRRRMSHFVAIPKLIKWGVIHRYACSFLFVFSQ